MSGQAIYISIFKGGSSTMLDMQDGLKKVENPSLVVGYFKIYQKGKRWSNTGFTLFRVFANKYNVCITICNLYLQIKLKNYPD